MIGHLIQDHRLSRNFYKGIKGDNNVMIAAAAMNFKRMINKWVCHYGIFFPVFFKRVFNLLKHNIPKSAIL